MLSVIFIWWYSTQFIFRITHFYCLGWTIVIYFFTIFILQYNPVNFILSLETIVLNVLVQLWASFSQHCLVVICPMVPTSLNKRSFCILFIRCLEFVRLSKGEFSYFIFSSTFQNSSLFLSLINRATVFSMSLCTIWKDLRFVLNLCSGDWFWTPLIYLNLIIY